MKKAITLSIFALLLPWTIWADEVPKSYRIEFSKNAPGELIIRVDMRNMPKNLYIENARALVGFYDIDKQLVNDQIFSLGTIWGGHHFSKAYKYSVAKPFYYIKAERLAWGEIAAAGDKGDFITPHISGSSDFIELHQKAAVSNLTGIWKCNFGGNYWLRQVGDEVWWYGLSPDNGGAWTNVFHGHIRGGILVGSWADIPIGQTKNHGTLKIRVEDNRKLKAIDQSGGFGSSVWTR